MFLAVLGKRCPQPNLKASKKTEKEVKNVLWGGAAEDRQHRSGTWRKQPWLSPQTREMAWKRLLWQQSLMASRRVQKTCLIYTWSGISVLTAFTTICYAVFEAKLEAKDDLGSHLILAWYFHSLFLKKCLPEKWSQSIKTLPFLQWQIPCKQPVGNFPFPRGCHGDRRDELFTSSSAR